MSGSQSVVMPQLWLSLLCLKIIITVALSYELEGKVKTKRSWHLSLHSKRDQAPDDYPNEQFQTSKSVHFLWGHPGVKVGVRWCLQVSKMIIWCLQVFPGNSLSGTGEKSARGSVSHLQSSG